MHEMRSLLASGGLIRPCMARAAPVWGVRWQSSGAGSFYDGVTKAPAAEQEKTSYTSNADLRSLPEVRDKLEPQPRGVDTLLSPLKFKLAQINRAQNHGTFVNNQVVEHEGKKYKLSLSHDEQRALEPSVYIQSYRIQSSWKKTYMLLRMFRKMPLMQAITQCHFSSRRMARDIGEMLERGADDARKLGLEPAELVVDQIWVGKDGEDEKQLQAKGRGRTGVITHPHVHVKAVLKPAAVGDARQTRIKDRLDRKLWFPLTNWKIKEDYVQTANYKW